MTMRCSRARPAGIFVNGRSPWPTRDRTSAGPVRAIRCGRGGRMRGRQVRSTMAPLSAPCELAGRPRRLRARSHTAARATHCQATPSSSRRGRWPRRPGGVLGRPDVRARDKKSSHGVPPSDHGGDARSITTATLPVSRCISSPRREHVHLRDSDGSPPSSAAAPPRNARASRAGSSFQRAGCTRAWLSWALRSPAAPSSDAPRARRGRVPASR